MNGHLIIREERPEDYESVREINTQAFETPLEADLVDEIRRQGADSVSLVASLDGKPVGYILFSPAVIGDGKKLENAVGLAPVAVLPDFQSQGIGSRLIREGLNACGEIGAQAVIVLGHAAYYPRFGFRKASDFGIKFEFDAPDEACMVCELSAGALAGITGTACYHDAFRMFV